jgi:cell division protein FtsB
MIIYDIPGALVPYGKKRHGKNKAKLVALHQKKNIYEEKLHQFNYEEAVQEDARIFNAANARYF